MGTAKGKGRKIAGAKPQSRHTPLKDHRRNGSTLFSPLSGLSLEKVSWCRDLLPEHLWIASLKAAFPDTFVARFNKLLDALDPFFPAGSINVGFVSDFGRIPIEQRRPFLLDNADLVYETFHRPFGRLAAFYTECPAYWLVQQECISGDGPLDPGVELSKLSRVVASVFDGHNPDSGLVRTLPFTRLVRSGQLSFARGIPVETLSKYPTQCTAEERTFVELFCRASMGAWISCQSSVGQFTDTWAKYFWRHNFNLVPCIPRKFGNKECELDAPSAERLRSLLQQNCSIAEGYIDSLVNKVKVDLFDPTREEVLTGLLSRMVRFYVTSCCDTELWSRDLGGIMLRCMTDTAITFAYLAKAGTPEEFSSFVAYGDGKQKLLMLQLQDNYPSDLSLEGKSSGEIADELGDMNISTMDMSLANWTKKSVRDLAFACGMERYYRLVYDPASCDLHGTWLSLRTANLVNCGQPLHRFHRLPHLSRPSLYINVIEVLQEILEAAIGVATKELAYPALQSSFVKLRTEELLDRS
jgi:hypothetical protein